ncbi:MAG: transposase [Limisphaerales bacterium]
MGKDTPRLRAGPSRPPARAAGLASAPAGPWQAATMPASIRLDGPTACMAMDAAMDTEIFQACVREVPCPTLRPGDLVVMDNLPPHQHGLTPQPIEQAGASARFLPAFSPDLNPIERRWSEVELLRRGAEARTGAELQAALAAALACVTAQDARNGFASCGYRFIQCELALPSPLTVGSGGGVARAFTSWRHERRHC